MAGPVELPTVSEMVVDAVNVPEVPAIITADVPATAVLLAVNATILDPVVGLVPNAAVTPVGNPEAASVTLPANPFRSATAIESVPLAPGATESDAAEGAIVKLGAPVTLNAIVALAIRVPEVPVMVTIDVPAVAALPAVNVSRLVAIAGLEPNVAVTPLGSPEAVSVTLPVNPFRSVTAMASVPLAFGVTERDAAEGVIVKLGAVPTVSATVVLAVKLPELPLMVTVEVPAAAVVLAANVTTLLPVVGLVPNVAVTPLGNPVAERVTLPVKGLTSVTAIVSVVLLPCVIANVAAEDASLKLPVAAPPLPHVTPLSVNDVGIELVTLFQVPLKPTPVTLPPAGMLPS